MASMKKQGWLIVIIQSFLILGIFVYAVVQKNEAEKERAMAQYERTRTIIGEKRILELTERLKECK